MAVNYKIMKNNKIKLNTEMKNLNEDEKELLQMYIKLGYIIDLYTPDNKTKNYTPEENIKKHITKDNMLLYIKNNDPDGINEYNNQDSKNFMKLKKWFFDKYPNYMEEQLKKLNKK